MKGKHQAGRPLFLTDSSSCAHPSGVPKTQVILLPDFSILELSSSSLLVEDACFRLVFPLRRLLRGFLLPSGVHRLWYVNCPKKIFSGPPGSNIESRHSFSVGLGHIFCSNCLDAICEKTWSPRQLPACPFCREPFTKDTVRKIRVDLKTPRRSSKEIETDCEGEPRRDLSNPSEAKRLEEKVAKAAANKCSFEEVSELHREIQQWLASEVKRTSASQVTRAV